MSSSLSSTPGRSALNSNPSLVSFTSNSGVNALSSSRHSDGIISANGSQLISSRQRRERSPVRGWGVPSPRLTMFAMIPLLSVKQRNNRVSTAQYRARPARARKADYGRGENRESSEFSIELPAARDKREHAQGHPRAKLRRAALPIARAAQHPSAAPRRSRAHRRAQR